MDDFRADGVLRNAVLGYGHSETDAEVHHRVDINDNGRSILELENLYEHDALSAKVVDKAPNKALAAGFRLKVNGKPVNSQTNRRLRRTNILPSLCEALKLARIYPKGAAVVLNIDDGQGPYAFDRPVVRNNIRSVSVAFVADGERIFPEAYNIIGLSSTYYQMSLSDAVMWDSENAALTSELSGATRIHRDRVLWLEGVWTPPNIKMRRNGSISFLDRFWRAYAEYVAAKKDQANLLHKKEVLNVKRKGLNTMIASATAAEEKSLQKEAANYRRVVTNQSVVLSDMDDVEFDIIKRDMAHTKDAVEEARYGVVAASGGLTELDIFGLTTGTVGLAKDGLRDRMITEEAVIALQETQLREPLEKFLEYAIASSDNNLKINPNADWEIEFPSSLRLSPSEKAEIVNKYATVDSTYAEKLGIPKEDIVASRWGGGEWSPNLELADGWRERMQTTPPAPTGEKSNAV